MAAEVPQRGVQRQIYKFYFKQAVFNLVNIMLGCINLLPMEGRVAILFDRFSTLVPSLSFSMQSQSPLRAIVKTKAYGTFANNSDSITKSKDIHPPPRPSFKPRDANPPAPLVI